MSEVTAEMIENGRARDPASASRRRKMTVKMREAREKLTTANERAAVYAPDLLRLFAQSNRSAMPFMCLLVLAIAVTALMWVPTTHGAGLGRADIAWRWRCSTAFRSPFSICGPKR